MAMEDYVTAMQNACPAGLGQELTSVDFDNSREFNRSSELMRKAEANEDCAVAFARFLAVRYLTKRDLSTEVMLIGLALRLPETRRAEAAPEIRRALEAMTLSEQIAHGYFRALLFYGLDLRDRYAARFPGGSVTGADYLAMSYYKYLAELGDPDGLPELDRAAKRIEADQHALIGLLVEISDLRRADASYIFQRYLNDQRRGIGVNGPGSGPTVDMIAQRGLRAMEFQVRKP